jgi:hypothetical protein
MRRNKLLNPASITLITIGIVLLALPAFAGYSQDIPPATLNVFTSLHTVGNGGSTKTGLDVKLKIFDLATLSSPINPKDYGTIWNSGPGILPRIPILAGVVKIGGGNANWYPTTYPGPTYWVAIGETDSDYNGSPVYVGKIIDQLVPGGITDINLQVILNSKGKITPATTAEIPGSMLLISQPEYLEFTGSEELFPIIYESIEGDWSSIVQADMPAGYVSTPGAQQASVSTSQIQALEFSVKETDNQAFDNFSLKVDEKSARVAHHLLHKGKMITVTFDTPLMRK